MPATAMDTHRIVKRLKEAGFSDAQAETVTDVLRESREAYVADLVTRNDLVHLATKADLSELKADMIKWLVPLLLGQTALIAALVKLL